MAVNTTTSLSNQFQRKYQKDLLKHAVQALRLNEFAQQKDLPKNLGAKSVRYFRRNEADASEVQTLSEGTAPTARRTVSYTPIDVDLVQLGEVLEGTDILGWTALLDWLGDGIKLLGEDCALKCDSVIRDEIVANVTTAGQVRYAQGAADFAALLAASTPNAVITRSDWLKAVTQLKINRAPTFAGYYACIIPPQASFDVQEDDDWLEAAKYGSPQDLFKGELGRRDGIRFVEATNPFIEDDTEGTFDATGGIFSTIIVGQEAYGCVKLAGTQSPHKPQMIILKEADKSDPLNQKILAGWKAFYNAKLLNEKYAVVLRSKSGFNG